MSYFSYCWEPVWHTMKSWVREKSPKQFESKPERRKMSKYFGSQSFQKTIQLVLIVVLLATTLAFLPQPAVAADHSALNNAGVKGTLTAQLNGRKVTISGTNFNSSREFIVNAKSGNGSSTKLGVDQIQQQRRLQNHL